jgi:hypothetical protein
MNAEYISNLLPIDKTPRHSKERIWETVEDHPVVLQVSVTYAHFDKVDIGSSGSP